MPARRNFAHAERPSPIDVDTIHPHALSAGPCGLPRSISAAFRNVISRLWSEHVRPQYAQNASGRRSSHHSAQHSSAMLPVVSAAVGVPIVAVIATAVTPVLPSMVAASGVAALVAAPVTVVAGVMAARGRAMTRLVPVDVLAMPARLRLGRRRHRRETAHGKRHGDCCNERLHWLCSSARFR